MLEHSLRERSSIMSASFFGGEGLIKNADTADAGEGVSDKMLTLLILGSGGVKSHGLEQKSRENDTNNH